MVAMGYALIALAVITAIFSIAFIRRPDQSWNIYESWKWQDPEANRPSPRCAALRCAALIEHRRAHRGTGYARASGLVAPRQIRLPARRRCTVHMACAYPCGKPVLRQHI